MTPFLVAWLDDKARRMTALALRHDGFVVKVQNSQDHACSYIGRHQILGVVGVGTRPPAADAVRDLRCRTDLPIVVIVEQDGAFERAALVPRRRRRRGHVRLRHRGVDRMSAGIGPAVRARTR